MSTNLDRYVQELYGSDAEQEERTKIASKLDSMSDEQLSDLLDHVVKVAAGEEAPIEGEGAKVASVDFDDPIFLSKFAEVDEWGRELAHQHAAEQVKEAFNASPGMVETVGDHPYLSGVGAELVGMAIPGGSMVTGPALAGAVAPEGKGWGAAGRHFGYGLGGGLAGGMAGMPVGAAIGGALGGVEGAHMGAGVGGLLGGAAGATYGKGQSLLKAVAERRAAEEEANPAGGQSKQADFIDDHPYLSSATVPFAGAMAASPNRRMQGQFAHRGQASLGALGGGLAGGLAGAGIGALFKNPALGAGIGALGGGMAGSTYAGGKALKDISADRKMREAHAKTGSAIPMEVYESVLSQIRAD